MLNRSAFFYLLFFICFLFSYPVQGADAPRVYTNEDIEKFKGASDEHTQAPPPSGKEDRDSDRKYKEKRISEEQEMEYWCKKAKTVNRRVEDDRETLKELEDKGIELNAKSSTSHKKTATLVKKLEKAKKHLRNSEGDLKDLEDEAHRKGVPPGWLRCQL